MPGELVEVVANATHDGKKLIEAVGQVWWNKVLGVQVREGAGLHMAGDARLVAGSARLEARKLCRREGDTDTPKTARLLLFANALVVGLAVSGGHGCGRVTEIARERGRNRTGTARCQTGGIHKGGGRPPLVQVGNFGENAARIAQQCS